jgi:tetratricopeptide (TPR) repeat protein
MIQQLQANPSDTALRERIIATARELKPAPAIPEAARASFVEGTTIAQSAKDAAGQALAVQRFEEALKIAPWWGDAWYNLAVAQELAGQLGSAQESLRLYILTGPDQAEARKAQDRIYALKAKKDLAATEAANAKEQAQADPELLWNGPWRWHSSAGADYALQAKKTGDMIGFCGQYGCGEIGGFRGRVQPTGEINWEFPINLVGCGIPVYWVTIQATKSNAGRRLEFDLPGQDGIACKVTRGTHDVLTRQ